MYAGRNKASKILGLEKVHQQKNINNFLEKKKLS